MALDWREWHKRYDDPESPFSLRLAIVQEQLRQALDRCPSGPIRLVSLCAGEARDVLPVLRDHPRRADVSARLVELDRHIAAIAQAEAARLGLAPPGDNCDRNGDGVRHDNGDSTGRRGGGGVRVAVGDAGLSDRYEGAVPAEVVVACGIFGNLADESIRRLISCLPQLCAPGATVIWTRHRRAPDVVPAVLGWFGEYGFEELDTLVPEGTEFCVGAHRFRGVPQALRRGIRMFAFADERTKNHWSGPGPS